jgi:hypothetical protein
MAARYSHLGEKHLAKVAENLNGVLTLLFGYGRTSGRRIGRSIVTLS